MVNLVRDSLPDYGTRAYGVIARRDVEKKTELGCAISGLRTAANIARRSGETEAATRWDSDADQFQEILRFVECDSRAKTLGALRSKKMPGALLYLASLEEYIIAKTGTAPRPTETAHIVCALLTGFDRYPDAGIDPDLLARKLKGFRKRNPLYIQEIKQKNKCNSAGKNELDRIYGNSAC